MDPLRFSLPSSQLVRTLSSSWRAISSCSNKRSSVAKAFGFSCSRCGHTAPGARPQPSSSVNPCNVESKRLISPYTRLRFASRFPSSASTKRGRTSSRLRRPALINTAWHAADGAVTTPWPRNKLERRKMASAAAGVSQDSLTSQAAAQYASNVVSRVPVALHCPQAAISPATAPPRGDASPVLGGSGYGPPVLTQLTSVQRIVKEAVEVRREYDLVCLPVTNDR
jgi:hypothetical protein